MTQKPNDHQAWQKTISAKQNTKTRKNNSSNRTRCPHCNTVCTTLRTEQLSPNYREIFYLCSNDTCSCIWVASITPVRTIAPSKNPNAEVRMSSAPT